MTGDGILSPSELSIAVRSGGAASFILLLVLHSFSSSVIFLVLFFSLVLFLVLHLPSSPFLRPLPFTLASFQLPRAPSSPPPPFLPTIPDTRTGIVRCWDLWFGCAVGILLFTYIKRILALSYV